MSEFEVRENGLFSNAGTKMISREGMDSIRAQVLAERDRELGRWRWPENPNWVVYEIGEYAVVMSERYADIRQFTRDEAASMTGLEFRQAARAYFDAHPEEKPWHSAKSGEAWVITYGGEEYAVISDGASFLWEAGSEQPITDTRITSARRIWPEDSE